MRLFFNPMNLLTILPETSLTPSRQKKVAPGMSGDRLSFMNMVTLAQEAQKDTGSHGGTDDSGDIRTHGMHQQVIARVELPAHSLRHSCAVRHCGDACVADERIDLPAVLEEQVPEFYEQHTAGCRDDELRQTKSENLH